jgi:phosphatidylglycerophosphatase A
VQPYYYITVCFVLVTTLVGFWSVREILLSSGDGDEINRSKAARDPQWIVIDEWAGMGVSLLLVSPESPLAVLVAFVLFRIFDASKFWLVGVVEQFPGAGGVMWDDLVAGAFACLGVAMFVSWF